ncbi:MAG: DUF4234 domain-containing protein [Acidobacteriota bacterium]|nr:DUF4234 domain-containing protein [Acidobacteriota bacterium]
MTTWSPVGEVLGPGVAPAAPPPPDPEAPRAPFPPASVSRSEDVAFPKPPSLHWALVLLLTFLTCGLFGIVWMFVQAVWVRRIDPTCNALFILAVGIPLQIIVGLAGHELLATLVGAVATTWASFQMRSVIEARFGIALSGVMTFFFNVFYLQYHMTAIAEGEHALREHSAVS